VLCTFNLCGLFPSTKNSFLFLSVHQSLSPWPVKKSFWKSLLTTWTNWITASFLNSQSISTSAIARVFSIPKCGKAKYLNKQRFPSPILTVQVAETSMWEHLLYQSFSVIGQTFTYKVRYFWMLLGGRRSRLSMGHEKYLKVQKVFFL
jgi:hypothetical protein